MVNSSRNESDWLLRKTGQAGTVASQIRVALPFNLSIAERFERMATDSPFQLIWQTLTSWYAIYIAGENNQSAARRYNSSYRAWVYGRPISDRTKNTYHLLKNRGMSRKDLRIAIFSGIIQADGSIKTNWLRFRVAHFIAWAFIITTTIGLSIFAVALILYGVNWWISFTAFSLTALLITFLEYPLIMLGFRPLQVATKINRLDIPHLRGVATIENLAKSSR